MRTFLLQLWLHRKRRLQTAFDAKNLSLDPSLAIPPPSAKEFLNGFVGAGRPVLIKGLIDDWQAVRRWTPEYLSRQTEAGGDHEVPYRSTPLRLPRADLGKIQRGRMSLLTILNECARSPDEGPEIYVPGFDLAANTPLAHDVGRPGMLSSLDIYATTVFLGRNTKCIGHFHPKTQALLCQVQGIKRVSMYPPTELRRLYLGSPWSGKFFQSQINFYGDRELFPLLSRAKRLCFELHPGDALFIPLHWLHVPEGKGWNVSVTHWWRPDFAEWMHSAATLRALLGIGFFGLRHVFQRRSIQH